MIKKSDALTKITAKEEADEKALEAKIDESLDKFHGSSISVSVEGVSPKVVDRVRERYGSEGGWTVNVTAGDQRDPGPWLTFS